MLCSPPATGGSDHDRVRGLAGDDELSSRFNNTLLSGGLGGDLFLTELDLGGATVLARQKSGDGRDDMTATIDLDCPVARRARLVLDGGDGNDRILAKATVASGDTADAVISASGGDGRDRIETTARLEDLTVRGNARNLIDAGEGDDRVTSRARGQLRRRGADLRQQRRRRAGNDRLRAFANVGSNTGGFALNDVSGGGDEEITSNLRASR